MPFQGVDHCIGVGCFGGFRRGNLLDLPDVEPGAAGCGLVDRSVKIADGFRPG
jgi:hypothetical protein